MKEFLLVLMLCDDTACQTGSVYVVDSFVNPLPVSAWVDCNEQRKARKAQLIPASAKDERRLLCKTPEEMAKMGLY